MNERLDTDLIQKGLNTSFIGRKVCSYKSLKSTNETAKDLARGGEKEGSMVISEEQTGGYGRFGRAWYSPEGGLWFSLILFPEIPAHKAPLLSLIASLSVVEAIRNSVSLNPLIRWPNDVLINEKKVCGILSEFEIGENDTSFIIVGIGINVNQTAFPPDLEEISTSIHKELGQSTSRLLLLQELLWRFEENYTGILRGEEKNLIERIKDYSSLMGKRVTINMNENDLEGEMIDLDDTGRLILRLDNGIIKKVTAGDVRLVR
jgi:BirA family biotin operon repressor/biotin-[acetyl-CoA-carboxylase] ligase